MKILAAISLLCFLNLLQVFESHPYPLTDSEDESNGEMGIYNENYKRDSYYNPEGTTESYINKGLTEKKKNKPGKSESTENRVTNLADEAEATPSSEKDKDKSNEIFPSANPPTHVTMISSMDEIQQNVMKHWKTFVNDMKEMALLTFKMLLSNFEQKFREIQI